MHGQFLRRNGFVVGELVHHQGKVWLFKGPSQCVLFRKYNGYAVAAEDLVKCDAVALKVSDDLRIWATKDEILQNAMIYVYDKKETIERQYVLPVDMWHKDTDKGTPWLKKHD